MQELYIGDHNYLKGDRDVCAQESIDGFGCRGPHVDWLREIQGH
jgi:hypothetical protein